MSRHLLLACALVLALALPARAEGTGFYGGLKIIDSIQTAWVDGYSSGSYTQNTVGGGIFAGYDFYPQQGFPARVEVEYALRSAMEKHYHGVYAGALYSEKFSTNLHTIMGNVYFDLHNSTPLTPYVGAGLGIAFVNGTYERTTQGWKREVSDYQTEFAWNIGAGCSYAFNEMVSADLAYRYVDVTEASFKDANVDPSAHEISLGLRISF